MFVGENMMLFKLLRDSKGPTAIEYALIASLIAVVAISGMRLIGNKVNNQLGIIADALSNVEEAAKAANTSGNV